MRSACAIVNIKNRWSTQKYKSS